MLIRSWTQGQEIAKEPWKSKSQHMHSFSTSTHKTKSTPQEKFWGMATAIIFLDAPFTTNDSYEHSLPEL